MKNQLSLSSIAAGLMLIASSSYAQEITVTLTNDMLDAHKVKTCFVSTDLLDTKTCNELVQGKVSHTYSSGPKNINYSADITVPKSSSISNNCNVLKEKSYECDDEQKFCTYTFVSANPVSTEKTTEAIFSLTKAKVSPSYNLNCQFK